VVDIIVDHVRNKAAVDFQIIDREVLQVLEGRQAAAKIIQRKFKTTGLQTFDQRLCFAQVFNGSGFCDFETNQPCVNLNLLAVSLM